MKPRRFPLANKVFRLPGGNEDNDLWVEQTTQDNYPIIRSLWVPTKQERKAIAEGYNISLVIWGEGTPPVGISITHEQPGKDVSASGD